MKTATLTSRDYAIAFRKSSEYEYGMLGTDRRQLVRELNKILKKKFAKANKR